MTNTRVSTLELAGRAPPIDGGITTRTWLPTFCPTSAFWKPSTTRFVGNGAGARG